jgi:hypothetical protein
VRKAHKTPCPLTREKRELSSLKEGQKLQLSFILTGPPFSEKLHLHNQRQAFMLSRGMWFN